MANFKPSTDQIIQKSKEIKSFLGSQQYKELIGSNDISTQNSPYKNGDQTYLDSIELMETVIDSLIRRADIVDKIDHGMRSNFINYLNNIHSWISTNPIGNWNNILSHANTMYQWVYQWGIYVPEQTISKKAIQNIERLEIKDEEIRRLKELRTSLEQIVTADSSLEKAQNIIDYAKREQPIIELDKYLGESKRKIEEITQATDQLQKNVTDRLTDLETESVNRINNVLGRASDAKTTVHFKDVRDTYREELSGRSKDNSNDGWLKSCFSWLFLGWSRAVFWSIIFFIVNLLLVIYFSEEISIPADSFKNEYLRLISNGIIRLTCLSPSLIFVSFTFNGYYNARKMMRLYEEREVVSRTADGQIVLLQDRGVEKEIINSVVGKMYGIMYGTLGNKQEAEPSDKSETGLILLDKTLDTIERISKLNKP